MRGLDTLADVALDDRRIAHGRIGRQIRGKAQQGIEHRQDFRARPRVARRPNQGHADDAGEEPAKQELLAAGKHAHG